MFEKTTGDWNSSEHLLDPDGDGHRWDAGTGAWVGDPSGPPHGPDVDDQRALMWQLSHSDQEDLSKLTIYPRTQQEMDVKNNQGVNP